ncbi:helix-turn-helix transcriptional regulator [Aquimarina sp. RZ0]|uniref:helix-turn-helix domain-containing protein n=1 Tax=Aquimarina sp. RZ0 TaxID=2607730 RepID=UPI0011F14A33|nr:helix-turn-helix transcriptional regulator [Aquimarina sp. RZ0]KAA1243343.1 helix-turn-helix transcriptional regulator [Aquimarina sp. RZ0]
MNYISKNISYLLRTTGLGKDPFGETVGLKRGNIGSYIDGKAFPKIETLQRISETYKISIDDLINTDLANNSLKPRNFENNGGLNNYSVAQIIENIYIRDAEFTESPLLWMYIKLKILDGKVTDEKLIVDRLEEISKKKIGKV